MPWRVVANHPSCPSSKPFGVINKQTGQLERGGCHETRDLANRQLAALYAKEPQMQSTDRLSFPVEWKAINGSPGELDGYGVFFNNVDLGDDVALPGSCKKSLTDRETAGQPWPLIADHELATTGMVGSVPTAREDGSGVRLRARFASTQKAQDIRTLALEGHPLGMSITYNALQHYPGTKDGRQVRFLKEIRIHEFTITPFPMNPKARVLAVKTQELVAAGLDDEAFERAMRTALEIPWGPARKAAVEVLLAGYHRTTAADPADGLVTAPVADDTDDKSAVTTADTTDYASRFLASTLGPRDDAPGDKPPTALVDPLTSLKVDRQNAQADRLEAEINRALGGNQ